MKAASGFYCDNRTDLRSTSLQKTCSRPSTVLRSSPETSFTRAVSLRPHKPERTWILTSHVYFVLSVYYTRLYCHFYCPLSSFPLLHYSIISTLRVCVCEWCQCLTQSIQCKCEGTRLRSSDTDFTALITVYCSL